MNTDTIRIDRIDNIAVMRINRPPANAIDLALAGEFDNALATIEESKDIGALILTATGSCFSAGLDLKAIPSYDEDQQRSMVTEVNRLFGRLYGMPLPAIAAVNGHAIAGGVILTLGCDYRIGAEGDYNLGLAEARVGVPFPVAAMAIVKSELNHRVARLMVLTARNLEPEEALASGVLDELQPPDRLLDRALEVAREMAELPRETFARIKRTMRGPALARIDDAVLNQTEPMLESWLSDETRKAASEALKKTN